MKPDYAETGVPTMELTSRYAEKIIEVKSKKDIEKIREVCLLGRKVLDYGHSLVKPGVTTRDRSC